MKWIPLLLLVSGCATANKVDVWPLRGSLLEVRNPTTDHQVIIARDGQGREWQVARIKPLGRACFRWPFIDGTGYLRTGGEDRITTQRFEPWSSSGWAWQLAGEPVATSRACR